MQLARSEIIARNPKYVTRNSKDYKFYLFAFSTFFLFTCLNFQVSSYLRMQMKLNDPTKVFFNLLRWLFR